MNLFDFLIKSATVADIKARDKESVIAELLQSLVKHKAIKKENYKRVLNKILEREKEGSTGIGKGLAVPHLKQSKYVDRMVGVFGRCREGVEYDAIDGTPCRLFFLILTPRESNDHHIKALKKVAQLARNADFCRFMVEAKDVKEMVDLLEEVDGA